ncbi:Dps family protein [Lacibacterium aquatile]|uniref:Dps family protein n=1 Tax=Lacibacterium aquatile TaxID=1168082 RepID=A0ABW5DLB2_9PROT
MAAKNTTKDVADKLSVLLADSYILTLKTQAYHWNVKGEHFAALHKMFEEQYNELAPAIDEVAERIRALGQITPASFDEFSKLSSVKSTGGQPKWTEMVENLLKDHKTAAASARTVIEAAEAVDDSVSADLATERVAFHDKTIWMLGALVS